MSRPFPRATNREPGEEVLTRIGAKRTIIVRNLTLVDLKLRGSPIGEPQVFLGTVVQDLWIKDRKCI